MLLKSSIIVRVEIFKEGDEYVGICPDLDVSSFGQTVDEARQSLREALEGFFEASEEMGTLNDILWEAGFVRDGHTWLARQPVSIGLVPVGDGDSVS